MGIKSRDRFFKQSLFLYACIFFGMSGLAQHARANPYDFAQPPKRIAIVIGNGTYASLPPLKSPIADAKQMAERLRALDFDVTEIIDLPTAEQFFLVDLPALQHKIETGDIVFFYFSGHGFAFEKFNYIAPTKLPALVKPLDLSDYALPIETIGHLLAAKKPGLLIMMLDACRKVPSLQIDDPENGPQPPKELIDIREGREGINLFVGYATKYDSTAIGAEALVPSLFTNHLILQLKSDEREFGEMYKDVIADVRVASNDVQFPGLGAWSASEFYLRPTERVSNDQREAWAAALSSERRPDVQRFSIRFSTSAYAAAARKWLNDHPVDVTNFTQFSPLAIESAWGKSSATIAATTTGLGFVRTQAVSSVNGSRGLDRKSLGVISANQKERKWSEEVTAMAQQQDVVALKDFEAQKTTSDIDPVTMVKVPFGTSMRILDVKKIGPQGAVLIAETATHGNVVLAIKPSPTGTTQTQLGGSLSEIDLKARDDAKDLVDTTPLTAEVAKLKDAGRTITWVSAAIGAINDPAKSEDRQALLTHTIYSLKNSGIETNRITSVSSAEDYIAPGVRVRIFGY